MAKTTGGLLSLGSSGSVADTLTFAKWKGRPYVRQKVTPSNPNTTAQALTRSTFALGSNIWKTAPALLVAPWDSFATGQVLTGRNAFMSRFVKAIRGQATLDLMEFSPGSKGGLPLDSNIVTPGSNQLSCALTPPTPPTGWTVDGCVAACILNDDPATITDLAVVAGEDVSDPYTVVLGGLTASVEYQVGAWVRWLKPDGTVAYGPSLLTQATPTV